MTEEQGIQKPLPRAIAAESADAITEATKVQGSEEQASDRLAGLSDARLKECKNALELQNLREKHVRDKETADEKARQQRITEARIACLLRWVMVIAVIVVMLCFAIAIVIVACDLLSAPFLSEKARSYLTAFVALGFGMVATRIFDKWIPK